MTEPDPHTVELVAWTMGEELDWLEPDNLRYGAREALKALLAAGLLLPSGGKTRVEYRVLHDRARLGSPALWANAFSLEYALKYQRQAQSEGEDAWGRVWVESRTVTTYDDGKYESVYGFWVPIGETP